MVVHGNTETASLPYWGVGDDVALAQVLGLDQVGFWEVVKNIHGGSFLWWEPNW
ncbi:hypothetical protein D3C74_432250 [compost metagenome]